MATVTVTLREITDDAASVLALRITPEQERFVTTVADSLAEASAHPEGNPWFRAVYDGDRPVGFVMLTQVGVDSDVPLLVASTVVLSLGLAPVFTLTNDLIFGWAPPERAGAASGISETGAELGGALAIALLGTLGIAVYRDRLDEDLPAGVPAESAEAAQSTLGGAVAVADELPRRLADELLDAAQEAFTAGLQVSALVSAVVAAVTAILAAVLLRGLQLGSADHADAVGLEASVQAAPPD